MIVSSSRAPFGLVIGLAASLGVAGAAGGYFYWKAKDAATSRVEVRPTNAVLVAVEDLSRLEVTEVRVEKVVDLTDRQQVLFGALDAEDQMLLVAAGTAVVGVDLDKLGPKDLSFDEDTRVAKLRLPQPEIFSSRLDPDNTYVYRRETSLLAKRNEQLEARARKEAIKAVEKAAGEPQIMERARTQAERQLTTLLTQLGAKRVEITWKGPGPRS